MRAPVDVFFFSAFFVLLLQTYKDMRTGKVDVRRNWVIQGELLAFVLLGFMNFFFYLAAIFATAVFNAFFLKNHWGKGDKDLLQWLLPGIVLLAGPFYVAFFLLGFIGFTGLTFAARKLFKNHEKKRPGVPLIFGAFLMVTALYYFF